MEKRGVAGERGRGDRRERKEKAKDGERRGGRKKWGKRGEGEGIREIKRA